MLSLCLLLPGFAVAGDNALTVVVPSPQETAVAPGRDFYFVVRVDDEWADSVVSASVRLADATGKTVREVRTGATGFASDAEGLVEYDAGDISWHMPELLYDPENPDSLSQPWIKCYYRDGYVVSYITGGRCEGFIDQIDEKGNPLPPLSAGVYTATTEIACRDGSSKRLDCEIVYAYSPDIVVSRFSPAAHLYNVTAEADAKGYRTLLDPLPGYWTPASIFKEAANDPYSAEIPSMWRYANGLEYGAGNVHFYLYNVSPTSTTQSVELAILQSDGAIDTRLSVYRYDIGEPVVEYRTLSGEEVTLTGAFVPFEKGDKLEICRAEIYAENRDDNALNIYRIERKDVDTDPADGVEAAVGQYVAFIGVAAPIQNEPEDLIPLAMPHSYQSANRVSTLRYTFSKDGAVVMASTRDVGVLRALAEGWTGESIYEFAHVFEMDASLSGTIEVHIAAYDAHDEPVAGGEENITLTID